MKKRLLLKDISLVETEDSLQRLEIIEERLATTDQAVIEYIQIRGRNSEFRAKVKAEISKFKSRRGPNPNGLAPVPFFELIRAIKKSFGLSSIEKTLEIYCHLHNLPPEKASNLIDKYRRGQNEMKKRVVI